MIVGELDLSVGSVLAASSMTLAIVSAMGAPHVGRDRARAAGRRQHRPRQWSLTTRTNVPSFVVTLGTNFGLVGLTLGLARLITGSTNVAIIPDAISRSSRHADRRQVRGGHHLVRCGSARHRLGAAPDALGTLFAIGGDKESARASGIPVARTKVTIFVLSGLGASLVGIIQTCLYNGASTDNGQSYVFDSIIAVVVGGVLLTGGYGSIVGVIFGTLTFAIVNEGIYYTGWNSDWASLILGILLTVAVLMNNSVRRLALSNSKPRKTRIKDA